MLIIDASLIWFEATGLNTDNTPHIIKQITPPTELISPNSHCVRSKDVKGLLLC